MAVAFFMLAIGLATIWVDDRYQAYLKNEDINESND